MASSSKVSVATSDNSKIQSPVADEPPAQSGYSARQIKFVIGGLMLAMLLASLDQTIVSTALTTISRSFGRPDLYSWVVTAYLLASTATTPLYGKISDVFGRKRIFQFAIGLFLVGSALCGLSQNMVELIVFRGVQGLGAGGLMSLAMAIVGDVVPPRQRGRYQGYFGAVFGASSVMGPLIGGFLVDRASWRWVFYVNIPVGLVALVAIQYVLKPDHARRAVKIDYTGAVLLLAGVSLFLVGVQNTSNGRGISTSTLLLGGAGLVIIAAFLWWETRASDPILPLRLFTNSVFAVSSALSLITGAVMFGAIIFLPQYLQLVKRLSPTVSGLHLLPMLVGLLVTSLIAGQLVTKLGRYKVFIVVGTAVVAVGLYFLSRTAVGTGFWPFSGTLFVLGVGLGLFMQTLVVAAQNAVSQSDLGVATSTISFTRTLGGALGASVFGAVLIAHEASVLPAQTAQHGRVEGPLYAFVAGMDRTYLWAVPLALVAFALSFWLRDLPMRTSTDTPAADPVAPVPVPTVVSPGAVPVSAGAANGVPSQSGPGGGASSVAVLVDGAPVEVPADEELVWQPSDEAATAACVGTPHLPSPVLAGQRN